MMNHKRFLIGLTALVLAMGLILTACGGGGGSGGASAAKSVDALPDLDTSKRVEIILYIFGTEPPRQKEVMDNLNKLLIERLNCTLDIRMISLSEYNTTYPLLFSSGEVFDLAYCAYWLNYVQLAQRGAFMPIENLFPKYAPKNYARQFPAAIREASIDGHLYGISSLMRVYSAFGPQVRTDLVEGKGWNGKMDTFADYEAYMDIVKANYPEIEPYEVGATGATFLSSSFMTSRGFYAMGNFYIDPSQPNPKLMLIYEYEPFITEYLPMVQRWAQKGFWPRDVLAQQNQDKFRFGYAASNMTNLEMYEENFRAHPEWNLQFYNWVTDLSYQSFLQDMAVVSATSQNPERALAVYDLITNDKEIFRALFYGIEGVSYSIEMENGQERIVFPDADNFAISNFWAARTDEFFLQFRGGPTNLNSLKQDWSSRIVDGRGAQKYRALNFDTSAVDTELAAITSAATQYFNPVSIGLEDPATAIPELKRQYEAAGIEKIRQDYQRQLDEYIANYKQ
jgi:putative aldouronate transport system substrate-binding protein